MLEKADGCALLTVMRHMGKGSMLLVVNFSLHRDSLIVQNIPHESICHAQMLLLKDLVSEWRAETFPLGDLNGASVIYAGKLGKAKPVTAESLENVHLQ